MTTKKHRLIKASLVGLALGLTTSLAIYHPKIKQRINYLRALEVPIGELKYHRGSLRSDAFQYCSAIILDFGEEAIFAHALSSHPYSSPKHKHNNIPTLILSRNAVFYMVEESKKRKLSLEKAFAIVNSGQKRQLVKILQDFEANKIQVKMANRDLSPQIQEDNIAEEWEKRSVYYNPKTNYLRISRNNEIKEYNIKQ